MNKYDLLAVGWDVGGWMGDNHGFSVSGKRKEGESIEWISEPVEIGIPKNSTFVLEEVLQEATAGKVGTLERSKVVIGIDAPLGFPLRFKEFVANNSHNYTRPEKEIYSELAYRETDRYIYENLDKKPLSATFDRLGTNATVAITHVRKWVEKYNFTVAPGFEHNAHGRKIIEVYPGLLKPSKSAAAHPPISDKIPSNLEPGTDAYDAALCSLMAFVYAEEGQITGLPKLVEPLNLTDRIEEEGWIYHFPPGFLDETSF